MKQISLPLFPTVKIKILKNILREGSQQQRSRVWLFGVNCQDLILSRFCMHYLEKIRLVNKCEMLRFIDKMSFI